jgi:hypothetical protein
MGLASPIEPEAHNKSDLNDERLEVTLTVVRWVSRGY